LKLAIEAGVSLLLTRISSFFTEQGIHAYVVGGFVRDVLLGRDTVDIDIAVAADALEIAPEVAAVLGGKYVPLDKINRVGRVILFSNGTFSVKAQRELDFSTFEGTIEQDLSRRDFTIDAMAIDLNQLKEGHTDVQLLDPFKGRDDLRRGVVRSVTETAFQSDAARLLRAVRLAAELGFSIDEETESLIRRDSHLIANVAGERVREELLRLLAVSQSEWLLPYLDGLGLITAIIPELGQAKGSVQPKEHFWDVFDHSLKTVVAVDFVLRRGDWEYAGDDIQADVPWSETLSQHFAREVSGGSNRRLLLKLAALLHDVAKPQAKATDSDGRIRFLGHAKEGSAIAVDILERLRFSAKEIKLVEIMVRHHLRPGQLSQQDELPSRRAIYRYFRDTGEAGVDVLFLSLADHLAARGPSLNLAQWQEHARMVEYVLSQRSEQESLVVPPRLVDGHDLINIFGMRPGPRVGELLEAVHEAQATGELATREEALSYIQEHLLSNAV
jgi:poly(A) polymerase